MNCKSLFVFFAACAVSFSVFAQSGSPSALSLRGLPDLDADAAPKTTGAGDASAEAAIRRALLSQPASEEEVTKALSFLPDVVAEVNGTKITKKEIVDLLLRELVGLGLDLLLLLGVEGGDGFALDQDVRDRDVLRDGELLLVF
ncbi:MAG: hypothetical protein IKL85_01630, partial [Lentisphaeria bacterium]|nr:hypothetical protein [Lentisphaeria bacterium]